MNIVLSEFCSKTTRLSSKTISTVGRVSDVSFLLTSPMKKYVKFLYAYK